MANPYDAIEEELAGEHEEALAQLDAAADHRDGPGLAAAFLRVLRATAGRCPTCGALRVVSARAHAAGCAVGLRVARGMEVWVMSRRELRWLSVASG